ncbi:MAG: hypothetical protein C0483_05030 [Pirellula sp.]|nr:hypothetical protein [Pirellula sp.]
MQHTVGAAQKQAFDMTSILKSLDFVLDGRSLAYRRSLSASQADAYQDAPTPQLAFFHGVLRNADVFAPLASQLGARYDLWLLEHRGHGASTPADRYLVVDFVADAVAWLRECVRRPVVLYGHSLGAMVAAGAAAACPDLVRGCILEDPPFRTLGPHIGGTNFLSYFSQIADLLEVPRSTDDLARALAEIRITDPQSGSTVRFGDTRDPVSLRFQAASLNQLDQRILTPLVGGQWMQGYDEPAIFARIRCPVLLLQADTAVGGMLVDDDVAEFRRRVPETMHIRLPGVGHMMHWQRTQDIANLTFAFVESLRCST